MSGAGSASGGPICDVARSARRRIGVVAALLVLVGPIAAGADEALRNWFDDPFVPLTAAIADCPLPAGPFISEADKLAQSHWRIEKGTTAWLAGEADRPKAFNYDREIAAALVAAVKARDPFPQTSLWATVQARVVYVEGCVDRSSPDVAAIEAFVRRVPNVQQAIAIVRTDARSKAPYRLRQASP